MAYLHLTRTIHMPVTADGIVIKNNFGIIIANIRGTSFDAQALADIINLGFKEAQARDDAYDEEQARLASAFRLHRD